MTGPVSARARWSLLSFPKTVMRKAWLMYIRTDIFPCVNLAQHTGLQNNETILHLFACFAPEQGVHRQLVYKWVRNISIGSRKFCRYSRVHTNQARPFNLFAYPDRKIKSSCQGFHPCYFIRLKRAFL